MSLIAVKEAVGQARTMFLARDAQLLEVGAGERSIAGRLLVYLSSLFDEYDVDIEYNRHGVDSKMLAGFTSDPVETDARIYPDLIVHRRGTDGSNILVVEIKTDAATVSQLDSDRRKLRLIRSQFQYEHSLLLRVPRVRQSSHQEWLFEWDDGDPVAAST